MSLKSHKDLVVWQKAMALVILVYTLTEKFPKTEIFGITSQTRRAAVSIPSQIAEGYGRNSQKQYYHFLSISYGSALELETQLILAKRLKLADPTDFFEAENMLQEVLKMLNSLMRRFKEAKP